MSTQYGNLRLEATVHQCPESDPQAHCHLDSLVISIQLGGTALRLLRMVRVKSPFQWCFPKGLYIYLYIFIYKYIYIIIYIIWYDMILYYIIFIYLFIYLIFFKFWEETIFHRPRRLSKQEDAINNAISQSWWFIPDDFKGSNHHVASLWQKSWATQFFVDFTPPGFMCLQSFSDSNKNMQMVEMMWNPFHPFHPFHPISNTIDAL